MRGVALVFYFFISTAIPKTAALFSCFWGSSLDGVAPNATATGCYLCWKTMTKYGSTLSYFYGGYCQTLPNLSLTKAIDQLTSGTASEATSGPCYNAILASSAATQSNIASSSNTFIIQSCTTMNTMSTCTSITETVTTAYCVCCSYTCNNSTLCSNYAPIASATMTATYSSLKCGSAAMTVDFMKWTRLWMAISAAISIGITK